MNDSTRWIDQHLSVIISWRKSVKIFRDDSGNHRGPNQTTVMPVSHRHELRKKPRLQKTQTVSSLDEPNVSWGKSDRRDRVWLLNLKMLYQMLSMVVVAACCGAQVEEILKEDDYLQRAIYQILVGSVWTYFSLDFEFSADQRKSTINSNLWKQFLFIIIIIEVVICLIFPL